MKVFRQFSMTRFFPDNSLTFPWLLVKFLTFPWHLCNSLTVPAFPDKWSPCVSYPVTWQRIRRCTFQRVDNSRSSCVRKRPQLGCRRDDGTRLWRHAAILDRRPPCCRRVYGRDVISERHPVGGHTTASTWRYVGACFHTKINRKRV